MEEENIFPDVKWPIKIESAQNCFNERTDFVCRLSNSAIQHIRLVLCIFLICITNYFRIASENAWHFVKTDR
jgi:hypothetical protein